MSNEKRDENGSLILPKPDQLSKKRVMVIVCRPKTAVRGVKMDQILMQSKDITYYEVFAGKFTFFGTQVYQINETSEETLDAALARRLRKEIPTVADKILAKMWHWKGLNLPRQQIPGTYYCDVFVAIFREYTEMEDILYGVKGRGTKQGIPQTLNREEVERMIRTSPDDFMMGAGIVTKDFFEALDAGAFDHL